MKNKKQTKPMSFMKPIFFILFVFSTHNNLWSMLSFTSWFSGKSRSEIKILDYTSDKAMKIPNTGRKIFFRTTGGKLELRPLITIQAKHMRQFIRQLRKFQSKYPKIFDHVVNLCHQRAQQQSRSAIELHDFEAAEKIKNLKLVVQVIKPKNSSMPLLEEPTHGNEGNIFYRMHYLVARYTQVPENRAQRTRSKVQEQLDKIIQDEKKEQERQSGHNTTTKFTKRAKPRVKKPVQQIQSKRTNHITGLAVTIGKPFEPMEDHNNNNNSNNNSNMSSNRKTHGQTKKIRALLGPEALAHHLPSAQRRKPHQKKMPSRKHYSPKQLLKMLKIKFFPHHDNFACTIRHKTRSSDVKKHKKPIVIPALEIRSFLKSFEKFYKTHYDIAKQIILSCYFHKYTRFDHLRKNLPLAWILAIEEFDKPCHNSEKISPLSIITTDLQTPVSFLDGNKRFITKAAIRVITHYTRLLMPEGSGIDTDHIKDLVAQLLGVDLPRRPRSWERLDNKTKRRSSVGGG